MNDIEALLRKQLEEYRSDNSYFIGIGSNDECWENTKSVDYVYKVRSLYNGDLNSDGKYEYIHTLWPDLVNLDSFELGFEMFNGVMGKIERGYLFLIMREVIDAGLTKFLYDMELGKINDFKKQLVKIIDDHLKVKILEYIPRMLKQRNCVKCKHWNHGRVHWYCLKGHSTRIELSQERFHETLIPFVKTSAHTCKDYEVGEFKKNFMEVKESNERRT